MSEAATLLQSALFAQDFTGPNSPGSNAPPDTQPLRCSGWCTAYQEIFRLSYFNSGLVSGGIAYGYTSPIALEIVTEALPVARHEGPSEARGSLRSIERVFGESASDLSKMLHVSRQMIYHYRDGMEPSLENFRRIKLIANLAEYASFEAHVSLESVMKLPQPESQGKSILALLAEESPDVPVVRRILLRASVDLQKRKKLTAAIGYATPHDRQDIMRTRHASGKPIYVTDPDMPGKIVQVRPDQSRVRGRMVNRVFVPDEE